MTVSTRPQSLGPPTARSARTMGRRLIHKARVCRHHVTQIATHLVSNRRYCLVLLILATVFTLMCTGRSLPSEEPPPPPPPAVAPPEQTTPPPPPPATPWCILSHIPEPERRDLARVLPFHDAAEGMAGARYFPPGRDRPGQLHRYGCRVILGHLRDMTDNMAYFGAPEHFVDTAHGYSGGSAGIVGPNRAFSNYLRQMGATFHRVSIDDAHAREGDEPIWPPVRASVAFESTIDAASDSDGAPDVNVDAVAVAVAEAVADLTDAGPPTEATDAAATGDATDAASAGTDGTVAAPHQASTRSRVRSALMAALFPEEQEPNRRAATSYLVYQPWGSVAEQLTELGEACAVAAVLGRTLVLPMLGEPVDAASRDAMWSDAPDAAQKMVWNDLDTVLDLSHLSAVMPCRVIPFNQFRDRVAPQAACDGAHAWPRVQEVVNAEGKNPRHSDKVPLDVHPSGWQYNVSQLDGDVAVVEALAIPHMSVYFTQVMGLSGVPFVDFRKFSGASTGPMDDGDILRRWDGTTDRVLAMETPLDLYSFRIVPSDANPPRAPTVTPPPLPPPPAADDSTNTTATTTGLSVAPRSTSRFAPSPLDARAAHPLFAPIYAGLQPSPDLQLLLLSTVKHWGRYYAVQWPLVPQAATLGLSDAVLDRWTAELLASAWVPSAVNDAAAATIAAGSTAAARRALPVLFVAHTPGGAAPAARHLRALAVKFRVITLNQFLTRMRMMYGVETYGAWGHEALAIEVCVQATPDHGFMGIRPAAVKQLQTGLQPGSPLYMEVGSMARAADWIRNRRSLWNRLSWSYLI
ncbi:hypothetical protein CXG81DRAFT_28851 [Caulochytrium protostelioides]|uniref:Uncharacterized protein n=1 Tax=Caulochytrium protostelioides TaxID=1555241 RepID=A0A4V1ITU8_9FUNG|nr:hypothetical protein CXG81DRAFT_28851 [Caulochytrium protostelioides]|eukprot:RKO98307.1 hypothetical protein CXG81DRAFT_28851 [Caulochytrium protostelioides]